jgi:hypothetical protein
MKQNCSLPDSILATATNNVVQKRLEIEKRDAVMMARRAGIVPDDWQSDLLRSDAKQMILNCSRQSGKSTISAVLAIHEAVYTPDSLILLLSPSLRQSQELFRKVKDIFVALQSPYTPQIAEESSLRLELDNGSRIIALPGSETTIRGFSNVALLIVDEAATCEDALFFSIKPMLAVSGGRIVLLSTPRGKRGFFHDVWTEGGDDWNRTRIEARECPRISEQWLEREKEAMPSFWFRQEFECEFVESVDSVFSFAEVQATLSAKLEPFYFEGDLR